MKMVVYEAVNRSDYEKIAEFLKSQQEAPTFKCWRGGISADDIAHAKEVNKELDIFVVEDDEGNIRGVICMERRGDINPKEPKIVTGNFCCMLHEDWENKVDKYIKECIDFMAREYVKRGFLKAEITTTRFHRNAMLELFRDYGRQVRQGILENEVYRVYWVDLKKYVEAS